MKTLLLIVSALYPVLVIYFYKNGTSEFGSYFIPRFLNNEKYTKKDFRKAGMAWFIFSIWLVVMVFTIFSSFSEKFMKNNEELVLGLSFVITVIALIFFLISFYYFFVGVFSRKQSLTSSFKSTFDKKVLNPKEIDRRLKKYTIICVSSLVILIVSIVVESWLEIELNGYVALWNVAFLAGFIFTVGPIKSLIIMSTTSKDNERKQSLDIRDYNRLKEPIYLNDTNDIKKLYEKTSETNHQKVKSTEIGNISE